MKYRVKTNIVIPVKYVEFHENEIIDTKNVDEKVLQILIEQGVVEEVEEE